MMNAEKLQRRLQWYMMVGQSMGQRTMPVVAFVEATSRHKVVKYYGGKQRHTGPDGNVVVMFPTQETEVRMLGKRWQPEDAGDRDADAIIEVIPVTRYECSCGKEHVSEYPYPSVWCSCGKKALPVPGRFSLKS